MKKNHLLLLIMAAFLFSCSGLTSKRPPRESAAQVSEARTLLAAISNTNAGLKTCKGTGQIRLSGSRGQKSARVAWVVSDPARLRMEIYGVAGQIFASLASDGTWFYLHLHADEKYYKKRATGASLERLISVSVRLDDIVELLSGRVPMPGYDRAHVEPAVSGRGPVLVLKKRWRGVVEKIYFDHTGTTVRKVEVFKSGGVLAYRAEFVKMQRVGGYRVPSLLLISNDTDGRLRMRIDRYWADVPVPPAAFVLARPDALGRYPEEDKP